MHHPHRPNAGPRPWWVLWWLLLVAAASATAGDGATPCQAESGPLRTPVLELYTSEGCSSCPPADRWLSTLKGQPVVAQAFHVDYWDAIGWVDRFALPAFAQRQRQQAAALGLRGLYTPQVLADGRDSRHFAARFAASEPARATIRLRQSGRDAFEAWVTPAAGVDRWAAYWTLTEHGHASRVSAGENAGATLRHDFVVRQYAPVGVTSGPARLAFHSLAADPAHPRQVNLVVHEANGTRPLQALSLACGAG